MYIYFFGGGCIETNQLDVLSAAAADKGGCKKLFYWIRVLNIQRLLRWTNTPLPYNVYVLIAFFVVWIYIF